MTKSVTRHPRTSVLAVNRFLNKLGIGLVCFEIGTWEEGLTFILTFHVFVH